MIRSTAASAPERTPRPARRRSSILLALGLIAVSVFGGVSPASATTTAAPSITSPASGDGILSGAAPTIDVQSADFSSDVEVYLTPDGGATSLYCSGSTAPYDTMSCAGAALTPGGYTAFARADLDDTVDTPGLLDWSAYSVGVHFVVYNDDFPMITGSPAPSGDSDVTPTLIGTGPAMGTVHVGAVPTNPDNGDCDNVPVDATGGWGCTWGITDTATIYNVSVSAENYLGAPVSGSGGVSFQLREPYLASVTPEGPTTNYKEGLAGAKDVNTTRLIVEVSPTGAGGWSIYCDLQNLSTSNAWTCPAPTGTLGFADNYFRTTSYNEAGGLTLDGGPGYVDVQRIMPGQPTFTPPSTPTWNTDDPAEGVGGSRDPGIANVYVEIDQGGGNWVSYCSATSLSNTGTGWGCSEPDHGLQLGPNDLRVTGYTGDNVDAGTDTTQIELVAATAVTSPEPGGYTNSSAIVFSGTSGWEGQFAQVLDSVNAVQCDDEVAGGQWTCGVASQPDGTYTYKLSTTWTTRTFVSSPFTITIDTVAPLAPAVANPATTTNHTPTISGSGEGKATVTVYVDGSPAACIGGPPTVSAGNTWSCTLANPLAVGSYAITSRQVDRATNVSPLSAPVALVVAAVAALPSPEVTPTPTVTPAAVPFTWRLGSGLPDEVHPGDAIVLSASNLPPGLTVDAEFHSTVVQLGSTTVNQSGSFSLPVTVPADAPAGLHHFVVTVWTPAGEAVVVEQPVTVVLMAKDLAPTSFDHASVFGDSPGSDRSNPGAPSSLTHSIRDAQSLFTNPILLCLAALAAAALFLLVAFPAELLNSTISEQYARFSRRLPKASFVQRLRVWLDGMPVVGGVVITLVAALIFGFADPGFGFDVTSFRLVLSCAIALFVVGYLASVISGRILDGRWKLATAVELKPLGLILTIVGVVLSRLLDFSPGFLLGLILGLSLVGKTTVVDRAKNTLVQAGVVFALAIAGWVLYSVLSGTLNPDEFGTALLFDTLVAITSEGLAAVFIGMLPVKFLDGPSVIDYSKKLWGAAFIVSAFAFVAIIVPEAWGDINGPLWLWAAVLGGFTLVAVGIYLYFRFWAPPLDESEPEPEKQLVETP